MDEIQYFQTTEAPGRQMGGGRFVAVGSMLLLIAVATAVPILLMLRLVVLYARYSQYGATREWFGIIWLAGSLFAFAATVGLLGVGILRRRRWSRPLILALCWPWLTLGSILTGLVTSLICRDFANSYRPLGAQDFMMFGATLGTISTVGVVIPLVCVLLLKPESVRQALMDRDLTSRWTDSWSVMRLATLISLLIFSLGTMAICLDFVQSHWQAATPRRWFTLVCATAGAVLGMLGMARGYAIGWWLSVASLIPAGAVLGLWFIDVMSHSYSPFEEGSLIISLGLAIAGLLVLLLSQVPLRAARHALVMGTNGASSE